MRTATLATPEEAPEPATGIDEKVRAVFRGRVPAAVVGPGIGSLDKPLDVNDHSRACGRARSHRRYERDSVLKRRVGTCARPAASLQSSTPTILDFLFTYIPSTESATKDERDDRARDTEEDIEDY